MDSAFKDAIREHDHDEVRIILAAPYPGRPQAYPTTIALGVADAGRPRGSWGLAGTARPAPALRLASPRSR